MNRNILITGASGSLGSRVVQAFLENGDNICTIGRKIVSGSFSHIHWDIRSGLPELNELDFEQVIHIAGKAHIVPQNEAEKADFIRINLQGTKDILSSLDKLENNIKGFVFISSVSVYGLKQGENITEDTICSPDTIYGVSKLLAEQYVQEWCSHRGISYLILRLPLIAVYNPLGNLGTMKKSIEKSIYVKIKNNNAKKSLVLADDVARFLTKWNFKSGIYNLTDGHHPTVSEIENALEIRTKKKINFLLPIQLLKCFTFFGDKISKYLHSDFPLTSDKLNKLTSSLTFSDYKARKELRWTSNNVLNFIENEI